MTNLIWYLTWKNVSLRYQRRMWSKILEETVWLWHSLTKRGGSGRSSPTVPPVTGFHWEIYLSLSSVRRPYILKSPRRDWLPENFWQELIITCWDKLSSLHPVGNDFTLPHPLCNLVYTDLSTIIMYRCNNVGQRGQISINQCIWEIKDKEGLIKGTFDLH